MCFGAGRSYRTLASMSGVWHMCLEAILELIWSLCKQLKFYNHTFLVTAVISSVSIIPHFCSVSCRFHVNLQCGSHSGADVALHFNPRYESTGYVVNNTYQNRNWGSEERKYESPFTQGQTFTLQILVAQDAYKVQDHSLSDFLFLKCFRIALVLVSSFIIINY